MMMMMIMPYKTDIPHEVLGGGPGSYRHVILGTHEFEPRYFESEMLPALRARDADSILIISDQDEYRSNFSGMTRAGIDYNADYCHAYGGFNARFSLATWQGGAKLIVSGADLTASGWTAPGTIMGCVTYAESSEKKEDGDGGSQEAKILSDFGSFVSGMISKNLIKDKEHRAMLSDACSMLPQSDADQMFDVNLLSNLEKPILHQLRKYVDEPVESAKIFSPAGCDDGVMDFLAGMGCQKFEVCLSGREPAVPGSLHDAHHDMEDAIQAGLHTLGHDNDDMHPDARGPAAACGHDTTAGARMIILNTATRSFCLYGGADATAQGMLAASGNGGVELCMLAKSRGRATYDALAAGGACVQQTARRAAQDARGPAPRTPHPDARPAILGARLDAGNGRIHIHTDTLVESGRIVLRHPGDAAAVSIQFDARYKNFAVDADKECMRFCLAKDSGPVYVQVLGSASVPDGDEGTKKIMITSDLRWLSMPSPVPKPGREDVDLVRRTRGRSGLVTLLYKLDRFAGPDDAAWFCRFIMRITSKNLESVDVQRLYMVRKKFEICDAEYVQPPDARAMGAMLGSKFERTTAMTKKYMQEKYAPRRFDAAFDHFVMWSKIIVWLVAEKNGSLDTLRFIRMGIEAFLTMHKNNASDKKIRMNLNRLHFWEHALWLLYVVLSYQRRAGYFGQNAGVAMVFRGDVDAIFEQSSKKRFSRTAFEKIAREYSEFEGNDMMDVAGLSQFYESEFLRKLF